MGFISDYPPLWLPEKKSPHVQGRLIIPSFYTKQGPVLTVPPTWTPRPAPGQPTTDHILKAVSDSKLQGSGPSEFFPI